jgi:hypothetical protein
LYPHSDALSAEETAEHGKALPSVLPQVVQQNLLLHRSLLLQSLWLQA